MSSKDASHDNAAREGEKSAGQRASGGTTGHDAPGCCGAMMTEMMKACHGDPAGIGEASTQHKAPGFLGRLALRMMKTCCGDLSGKAPAPSGKN